MDLAAVYSRVMGGETLTIAASGWTYRNTFVLYDHETESLWYHLEETNGLTCIAGEHADRFLPERTSTKTRWSDWVSENPRTLIWNSEG